MGNWLKGEYTIYIFDCKEEAGSFVNSVPSSGLFREGVTTHYTIGAKGPITIKDNWHLYDGKNQGVYNVIISNSSDTTTTELSHVCQNASHTVVSSVSFIDINGYTGTNTVRGYFATWAADTKLDLYNITVDTVKAAALFILSGENSSINIHGKTHIKNANLSRYLFDLRAANTKLNIDGESFIVEDSTIYHGLILENNILCEANITCDEYIDRNNYYTGRYIQVGRQNMVTFDCKKLIAFENNTCPAGGNGWAKILVYADANSNTSTLNMKATTISVCDNTNSTNDSGAYAGLFQTNQPCCTLNMEGNVIIKGNRLKHSVFRIVGGVFNHKGSLYLEDNATSVQSNGQLLYFDNIATVNMENVTVKEHSHVYYYMYVL